MFKRKNKKIEWDKNNLIPILHSSICTGETVAGFKDKNTQKFTEIMLIENNNDLIKFMEMYDLKEIPKKEY